MNDEELARLLHEEMTSGSAIWDEFQVEQPETVRGLNERKLGMGIQLKHMDGAELEVLVLLKEPVT